MSTAQARLPVLALHAHGTANQRQGRAKVPDMVPPERDSVHDGQGLNHKVQSQRRSPAGRLVSCWTDDRRRSHAAQVNCTIFGPLRFTARRPSCLDRTRRCGLVFVGAPRSFVRTGTQTARIHAPLDGFAQVVVPASIARHPSRRAGGTGRRLRLRQAQKDRLGAAHPDPKLIRDFRALAFRTNPASFAAARCQRMGYVR